MLEVFGAFHAVAEAIREAVNACGVFVVAWGVAEAVWSYVRLRTVEHGIGLFVRAAAIRERLGVHLLLALDIFIAADIIGTVVHPDWTSLGLLAVIVVIRIVLSLLLTREIAQAHEFLTREGSGERPATD